MVPVMLMIASSRPSSPLANHAAALWRFNARHTRLPSTFFTTSSRATWFAFCSGVMPSSCDQEVKRSPKPRKCAVIACEVIAWLRKESRASVTSPLASWQEFEKYWLNCWIFFCSVSMFCMHFSHIAESASWNA